MRLLFLAVATVVVVGAGGLALAEHAEPSADAKRHIRLELAAMTFPAYGRQQVVYQVNEGGGWFNHAFLGLVGTLENHVAAVGAGRIDIRVILQGKGLDLLRDPDPALRTRIDTLRAEGVRFMVCRNSLIERAIEPSSLYGVHPNDIVRAAVAEIAALEAKGFVYLRL